MAGVKEEAKRILKDVVKGLLSIPFSPPKRDPFSSQPRGGEVMAFETPYRPCPICRTHLKPVVGPEYEKNDPPWKVYTCPNCGSEIWLCPFKNKV